eukprot:TRINITY_DN4173_c0_g1_i2.p1 TRINITY_DN4173_c0_g1~~TRINITY_DN4173_c0_g1_i2.p1  ORF type:complete len:186 (-),score=22.52 TRINITY_DN4173_c0_g1_i2:12-569(-)
MGGTIQVRSEMKLGSSFKFTIVTRFATPEETKQLKHLEESPENNIPPNLDKLNILVVDDNPFNRKTLQLYLKKYHIVCTTAENGKEAVQLVRHSYSNDAPFNIVFMDIHMPEMNGLEATKAIRDFEKEYRQILSISTTTPIIALSGVSATEQIREAVSAGMNDFITKPVKPEDLLQVLIKWGFNN